MVEINSWPEKYWVATQLSTRELMGVVSFLLLVGFASLPPLKNKFFYFEITLVSCCTAQRIPVWPLQALRLSGFDTGMVSGSPCWHITTLRLSLDLTPHSQSPPLFSSPSHGTIILRDVMSYIFVGWGRFSWASVLSLTDEVLSRQYLK